HRALDSRRLSVRYCGWRRVVLPATRPRPIAMLPYPAGIVDFTPILIQLESLGPAVVLSVGRIEDDLRFAAQYIQHSIPASVVGLIVTPLTLFRDTLGSAAVQFLGPSQWEPGVVGQPDYGPSSQAV